MKTKTKFCLSLHYNGDNSYLFVNRIEVCNFKSYTGIVKFQTQFCIGSISNRFGAAEFREVSLAGNAYDFSVNYNATD